MDYNLFDRYRYWYSFKIMNNTKRYEDTLQEHEHWIPERKSFVHVNGEPVCVDDIEILNVEEDITGRDLVTFEYQGVNRHSYVVTKFV